MQLSVQCSASRSSNQPENLPAGRHDPQVHWMGPRWVHNSQLRTTVIALVVHRPSEHYRLSVSVLLFFVRRLCAVQAIMFNCVPLSRSLSRNNVDSSTGRVSPLHTCSDEGSRAVLSCRVVHFVKAFSATRVNRLTCALNRRTTDHYTAIRLLVHWPLMDGLLQLVQRGGTWSGRGPAQSPPRCTKCNSPPING